MSAISEGGGATTQAGIYFQNCVAVLRLAQMLCGDDVSQSALGPIASVRVEAPAEVDDTVVTFSDGRKEFIQAKLNVEPGADAWNKLWQHFYREYQGFAAASPPRHVITLAARWSAKMSELEAMLARAASAESATEWRGRLTQPQTKLADNIRQILDLDDEELVRLCRVVKVWQLRFEGDPQETDSFESEVQRILKGTLEPRANIFPVLMEMAGDAARQRATITRDELIAHLVKRGFEFIPARVPNRLSETRRRQLEQQRNALNETASLAQGKLTALQQALIIETGAAVRFQLQQQVSGAESELEEIFRRIEEIEAKLS
ncbi:MAG TPA: hypothetical protein VJT09_11175 [Pyrinomonadaceae bacterium]|nr:hypothetical protein [Pyrinomonadaceae bacterium]